MSSDSLDEARRALVPILKVGTPAELRLAIESVLAAVLETQKAMRAAGDKRRALEERIKALESRPTPKYRGVWAYDTTYNEGDFVTDDGSVFHANTQTRTRPMGGNADWTLAVKKGRDAR